MKNIELEATPRSRTGTRATRALRAAGNIPAVMYGRGTSTRSASARSASTRSASTRGASTRGAKEGSGATAISVHEHTFMHTCYPISENTILHLKIENATHDVLIKDYDYDPRSGKILHLDFLELERGRELKTHLPIVIAGSSIGLRQGGILEQPLHNVEIECMPKDLPQNISIDISALDINQSIHVGDLPCPAGVRILNNHEQVVVHIAAPKVETAAPIPEEGDAEAETEE